MLSERIVTELTQAGELAHKLDVLVAGQFTMKTPADDLLLGYFSLVSSLHTGILTLIERELCAGAFALVRPIVEANLRAHVFVMGDPCDIRDLRRDDYHTNFRTIGRNIDTFFKFTLEPENGKRRAGLLEGFLKRATFLLHSFTHSGMEQINRQFRANEVMPNYEEDEVMEVINVATSAKFMVTILVTGYFRFDGLRHAANNLYIEYGERSSAAS